MTNKGAIVRFKFLLSLLYLFVTQPTLALTYEATVILPDKEKKVYHLIDGQEIADLKINYKCVFIIDNTEEKPNGDIYEDVSISCVHKLVKNSSFIIGGRCVKDKVVFGFPFSVLLKDGNKIVGIEAICTK